MSIRTLVFCLTVLGLRAADLSGTWEYRMIGGQRDAAARLQLKANSGKYTADLQGAQLTFVTEGDRVTVQCVDEGKSCGSLTGTVSGAMMQGSGEIDGIPMKWSAKRPAAKPAASTRHEFTPTVFYREFAADKPPALRIFPGDTVHTTTVDAGGRDAEDVHRVFGGNPLTGPFYVEGAMPGDVLVLKLTRVRTNRDSAGSGSDVVGSALDPWYFRDLPKVDKFDSTWKLDREHGIATLASPTDKLKNYRVPMRPMLGCIAVAPPPGQSFRAGELGGWGGNLDYNQLREGTTIFLPVNVPGALLFVGDGHAAQGDGELTGDALETSMDVEFSVDLQEQPAFNVRQLRFENADFVMFSGVANSLPEAIQRATTGAARWLDAIYKLNPAETAIVLGTAVQYEIAELVDPHVHVVAKLPRTALAGLKAE